MQSRSKKKKDAEPPQNSAASTRRHQIKRAIDWCLDDMFADVKLHGNIIWTPRLLIALMILTAWGVEPRIVDSFAEASKLSMNFFSSIAIATYQGMMRAFVSYADQLLPIVWFRLCCL